MNRHYKLAANFNTVEFEITNDDLLEVVDYENECVYNEDDEPEIQVSDDVLIKRILQREYDTLASIKVVNVAPDIKQVKTEEGPSQKMIEWATNLGMKNPEKRTKKEVWEFIQKNK